MTHKVSYGLFDWLFTDVTREQKQAEQDEQEKRWADSTASFSKTKTVHRAERTFLPDVCSDDDRRKIAHQNREYLLARQYQRGVTDRDALNEYITQRYLTPNPSNNNKIVIDEARRLYLAQNEYRKFMNDPSQRSLINYELFKKLKERDLSEASDAFNAILPELLAADANYYKARQVTKKPQKEEKEAVKYRTVFAGNEYKWQEAAPKLGDQTAFFRKSAKSSKTATTDESLADADAFWGMSAKVEKTYEPDLLDNIFSSLFKKPKK
jgi:hypothetical protein